MADKRMTVKKAAERLGIDPQTLRRWIRAGKFTATKLPTGRWGRREYRVSEANLQAFLSNSGSQ